MSSCGSGQVTNNCSQVTNNCSQVTNNCSQLTNNCSQVTNNCSQVTNNCSQVTNDCSLVTNNCSQVTNNCSQVTNNCSQVTNNCNFIIQVHIESVHSTGQEAKPCVHCGQVLPNPRLYNIHVAMFHTNRKCNFCKAGQWSTDILIYYVSVHLSICPPVRLSIRLCVCYQIPGFTISMSPCFIQTESVPSAKQVSDPLIF